MPEFRCAQCGASSTDDALDFPFCPGCRENLLKCRYCLFFGEEEGGCRHGEARSRFEANADSVPACPYHRSRLVPPALTRALHPVLWVVALGGLVFVFMFALRSSLGPVRLPPRAEAIKAEATGPERCVVGRPTTMELTASNEGTETSEPIAFEISDEFFQRFRVEAIVPDPSRTERQGRKRYLRYPPLQPRQKLLVRLYVTPVVAGLSNLEVALVAGENSPGMRVNVPLRTDPVRPAQPEVGARMRSGRDRR